jgi:hypothetical protein
MDWNEMKINAISRLDAINAIDDPETAHDDAVNILLSLLPLDVVVAYERLEERARWWTTS